MGDLRPTLPFPHSHLIRAVRAAATFLRCRANHLAPIGLAAAALVFPALAGDSGWLGLPHTSPSWIPRALRRGPPPSAALQVPSCPAGPDLVVGSFVTCSLSPGVHSYHSITIEADGTIFALGDPDAGVGVTLEVDEMTIQTDGQLSAEGQGYPGGEGPGAGTDGQLNIGAGGGGHGGVGGDSAAGRAGGGGYGDVFEPTTLGSGGGNNTGAGGAGGGAVHLIVAGTLTVDGALHASGDSGFGSNGRNPGGGAGGSLWIEAGTFTGAGHIYVDGDDGESEGFGPAGGGAGGRIALDYTTSSYTGSITAYGGSGSRTGGPGTIYIKPLDELWIDNAGRASQAAVLVEGVYDFDSIRLNAFGHLDVMGTGSSLTLRSGTVSGDANATLTTYGTVLAEQPFDVFGYTLDVQGEIEGPSDLVLRDEGELILHAHTPLHDGPYAFETVTVAPAGRLTLVPYDDGDADYTDDLPFELQATSVTIEPDGHLNSYGWGYPGGSGPGAGADGVLNQGGGGGGHGGFGGPGQTGRSGGPGYGDIYTPTTLGSGGGNNTSAGGAGGGAIHLVVQDTLLVDGDISASGDDAISSNGRNVGGGAGGSIWIETGTLAGGGFIMANGADGGDLGFGEAGSGAGGRIALDYASSTFSGEVLAHGCNGNFPGGPGTVYDAAENRLVVDNFNCDSQAAVLEEGDYSIDTIQLTRRGHLTLLGQASIVAVVSGTVQGDGTAIFAVEGTVDASENYFIEGFTLDVRGVLVDVVDLSLGDQGGLILRAQTPLHSGAHNFNQVTVASGGRLILVPFDDGDSDYTDDLPLELRAFSLAIETGGWLTSDARGYPGGSGPGAGVGGVLNQGGGGGGHGGFGGSGETGRAGGPGYGDVFTPTSLGSGGGSNTGLGGAGGGAVYLIVQDTTLVDGTLSADGADGAEANGRNPGGGAGGSIWIETGTLAGDGLIRANGGRGGEQGFGHAGGGAGGRIAIDYVENSFDGSVLAYGGGGARYGGPGTIYDAPANVLTTDNDGHDAQAAVLVEGDYQFDFIRMWHFGHLTILGELSTLGLDSQTVAGDGTAVLTAEGTVNASVSLTIQYFTLDAQGDLAGVDDLRLGEQGGLILYASTPLFGGAYNYTDLTVGSNGRLTVVPFDDGDPDSRFEIYADRISIAAGGVLSSDGLGYPSGTGPGAGQYSYDNGASGGGHGGTGGAGNGQPVGGAPYDSVYTPSALGSGGGTRYSESTCGGAGGGAIYLYAGESFILDGQVTADGSPGAPGGRGCGGGGGGSVWIETPSLSGNGRISVNGGSGSGDQRRAGGGAGGRIAVDAITTAFTGTLQAFGGSGHQYGGPGTVYFTREDRLIVSNDGHDGASAGLVEDDYDFEAIALSGYGHLSMLGTGSTLTLTNVTVVGDGTAHLTSFGTVSAPLSFSISGYVLDVQGDLAGVTDLSLTDPSGLVLHAYTPLHTGGPYAFGDVVVADGGLLTLFPYDDGDEDYTDDAPFELNAAALTVQAGGAISSDGLGYGSQRGPGAGSYSYDAGASGAGHGGAGGAGQGQPTAGGIYGDAASPAALGSGGGYRYSETACGGAGGGAIHLVVTGDILIDGRLSADGLDGIPGDRGCGGGSGGSLWIEAETILGNGAVTASGGDGSGNSRPAGGGGGGRIRIEGGATSVDLLLEAMGGSGFQSGEQGTIYVDSIGFPSDLSVTKTGPAEVVAGVTLEYTLSVRNKGLALAEAVVLQDTLPADVTYLSDNAPVVGTIAGGQVSWSLGDLVPGDRVTFSVVARVSPTAAVGSQLVNQAAVSMATEDDNPSDNTSSTTSLVVTGYRFTTGIAPESLSLGLGAPGVFLVSLQNTGLLPDRYSLSVTGLQPDWFVLSETEVNLSPGGSHTASLTVQVDECGASGEIPFTVEVASSAGADPQSLTGGLTLNTTPTISGLRPDNGATVGARDVLLQWRTDVVTTGVLTLFPQGQPGAAVTYGTEPGLTHAVLVEGLSRNTSYVWNVESSSSCGVALSGDRQFTVGNGIVFNNPKMSFVIDRDYDQRIPVRVTNQDNKPHTLKVEIQHPYDDIIVNFIGSGSVDETITLLPGESRAVTLAIHAQDAVQRDYDLTGLLTADEAGADPIQDHATIHLKVLAEADYIIEETGLDPVTGARSYRVTNRGKTITDLEIVAVDPVTGEPARVYLNPNVTHARLATDATLTFQVIPVFGPDDVEQAAASPLPGMRGLAVPNRAGIIPYELVSKAAGQIQRLVAQASCPEGNSVFPVTRGPVLIPFPASGWYCTNRPKIGVPFNIPAFVNPANVTGVRVRTTFSPRSEVRPHDTHITFNGTEVGALEDTVPSGTYEFEVPPEALRSGLVGTVQQEIGINSQHPNGGHYVVATDFEVLVALDSVTIYVCASSQEEAEAIVDDLYDLIPLPGTLGVSVNWPKQGMLVKPEADGRVNLKALVTDDLAAYFEYYDVRATIEYLDQPSVPSQTVALFDDGNLADHGDLAAKDDFFNALWAPMGSGEIRLTVEASAPSGLSATDSITFTIEALPDLAVTRVWQEEISLLNQEANIRAELTNLGFPVMGPVVVRFDYYDVDDQTGQPVGFPIHTSLYSVMNGLLFDRNALIEVEDKQFKAPDLGLFYVIVTVDP